MLNVYHIITNGEKNVLYRGMFITQQLLRKKTYNASKLVAQFPPYSGPQRLRREIILDVRQSLNEDLYCER